jgi:hypothetical protein
MTRGVKHTLAISRQQPRVRTAVCLAYSDVLHEATILEAA